MKLSQFLKQQRKENKLTQEELAVEAGVGLRLVREIEQGKTTMRMCIIPIIVTTHSQHRDHLFLRC